MKKQRRLVSFDWAIKRLLRSKANFDILEGFLTELLGQEIKILSLLESESNKDHPGQKINRLDLKVSNHKNEIIIIEIQYEREYDYFYRMMFAAAKAATEHLAEGAPYSDAVKVISINILYFDLGHGADYVYHGQTVFTGLHRHDQLRLSQEQQDLFRHDTPADIFPEFYLIKVNNFDDIARNSLDEWIYFLKNEEIKPGFKAKGLQQAKTRLDIMKLSESERLAYSRYSDDLHYQASMVQSSYGVGKLHGQKEGREEGIKEGIKEGHEKGQAAMCQNMLHHGMSPGEIAKITGLSEEKVLQLIKLAQKANKVSEPRAAYKPRKTRRTVK